MNEWIYDAIYNGWWISAKSLTEYRADCQHDLDECPTFCTDIREGLTEAIAQLDARIAELNAN